MKLSLEHREKIAESNRRAKAAPPDRETICEGCGTVFRHRPHMARRFCSRRCAASRRRRTPESRIALAERYRGSGNPAWKGGVTALNQRDRAASEYKQWRREVFRRDGFRCIDCGVSGCRRTPIYAHHLKSWAEFPALRFEVSNGVTVCHDCHEIRHGRCLPRRLAA